MRHVCLADLTVKPKETAGCHHSATLLGISVAIVPSRAHLASATQLTMLNQSTEVRWVSALALQFS